MVKPNGVCPSSWLACGLLAAPLQGLSCSGYNRDLVKAGCCHQTVRPCSSDYAGCRPDKTLTGVLGTIIHVLRTAWTPAGKGTVELSPPSSVHYEGGQAEPVFILGGSDDEVSVLVILVLTGHVCTRSCYDLVHAVVGTLTFLLL